MSRNSAIIRSRSVRSQLLKYVEITNDGEHFNENVFEFWETMENQQRALYKLAMQVIFVPASSASVERIFSTGGLIMRPHRSQLSAVNLEMLVALKCNHNLIV